MKLTHKNMQNRANHQTNLLLNTKGMKNVFYNKKVYVTLYNTACVFLNRSRTLALQLLHEHP